MRGCWSVSGTQRERAVFLSWELSVLQVYGETSGVTVRDLSSGLGSSSLWSLGPAKKGKDPGTLVLEHRGKGPGIISTVRF